MRNPTSVTARVSISAAMEGGLSLCSSGDILPTQVLTWLHASAYLPRSASMTFCPVFLLNLCSFSDVLLHEAGGNDEDFSGGAVKTIKKKGSRAKLSHFTEEIGWNATLFSHLEHWKYQLIKMVSGIACLIQIWKSYKKTSVLSQGDAGLNLRSSGDWSSATLVRVKISNSAILRGKHAMPSHFFYCG